MFVFGFVIILLVHSVSWIAHFNGLERIKTFRLLFDMGGEANVVAYFSALLIMCVAITCFILSHVSGQERKVTRGWKLLSAVFFFLSWDEAAQVHEKFNKSVNALLGGGDQGVFNFAWVIPYGLFVVLVILILIPFLKVLDRYLRLKLILAGAIYVGGAIGLEMVGADILFGSATYRVVVTIEESFEIIGMLLCFSALFGELAEREEGLIVRFVGRRTIQ